MKFDIDNFINPNLKDYSEYETLYNDSINDPNNFFLKQALEEIDWIKKPTKSSTGTLSEPKWFEDGTLNISYNCIDRHAEAYPDKTAIIWQGDEKDNNQYILVD